MIAKNLISLRDRSDYLQCCVLLYYFILFNGVLQFTQFPASHFLIPSIECLPNAYDNAQDSPNAFACSSTSSIAASAISGGYLYLRNIRFTISRRLARTLSRCDQSTVRFLRKFSVNS